MSQKHCKRYPSSTKTLMLGLKQNGWLSCPCLGCVGPSTMVLESRWRGRACSRRKILTSSRTLGGTGQSLCHTATREANFCPTASCNADRICMIYGSNLTSLPGISSPALSSIKLSNIAPRIKHEMLKDPVDMSLVTLTATSSGPPQKHPCECFISQAFSTAYLSITIGRYCHLWRDEQCPPSEKGQQSISWV